MCGLFFYQGSSKRDQCIEQADKISYRGPDNTTVLHADDLSSFVFHRLAINGLTESGNQPFTQGNLTLVCNGEIYNHEALESKYSIKNTTGSDCEVILGLFKKIGIEKTVEELDGVFMFVIYDADNKKSWVARDAFGVRPGFIAFDSGEYAISSEAKSLVDLFPGKIKVFEPGTWWSSDKPDFFNSWYSKDYKPEKSVDELIYPKFIRNSLVAAVKKRMMSDREVGCLLSGGLDSSLIASIVSRASNKKVKTFSIGMPGSIDLKYAKIVADYIGSDHHEIEISEKDFIDAIPEVIYNIESYDTTTVRASVGNYLVSKYISENTDVKVVFNGDGADEVCSGYIYGMLSPTDKDLYQDSIDLLKEIHIYDVLRSDRSISSNGLEPRTPFLDKDFVSIYMKIPGKERAFSDKKIEKYLLRRAFSGHYYLPDDVLWRKKCAFSDGVSDIKKSWHTIIQEHVESVISDKYFLERSKEITHCKPLLKESLHYRDIFESRFGKSQEGLIPKFWMPKWTDVIDPSAREIDGYRE